MLKVVAVFLVASWLSPSLVAWAETPAPAAVPGLSGTSRDRFLTALAALRSEDWNTAASEFAEPGWRSTPLADYAVLFQAEALLQAGDAAAARAQAQRAAGDTAESRIAPSALLAAATVLSGAGDDAGAAALYRRFLTRHGDHPGAARARLSLAQALLAAGRVPEAARAFNDVWILTPAAAEAETAAEQLKILAERGLAGPPPGPRERLERAERLLAAGLGPAARSEAEGLLAEDLPAAELRGRALKVVFEVAQRAGRNEAAHGVIARALSSLPPEGRPPWLLELARLQKKRSLDRAVATLDKLAREYPKSREASEAMLTKGRLLEEGSKLSEAQVVYRKLAAGYPEEDEAGAALWRLGWLAWFRGAHGEAATAWARILAIRGGRAYREATTYWIGRADELRGEVGLAARRFVQIQGEAPRSYYGILAARRSGPQGAVPPPSPTPVTLPADPLDPLQAEAGYARVEALRAVGLGTFADEEMAEMSRHAVGDPRLLYALSAAYVKESRYHLALRILRRHFHPFTRGAVTPVPRAFWEMLYPTGWWSELREAAGRAAVDPLLVAAVVREESSFYPRARSRVGARGLMQLMPETARPMAQARQLLFGNAELLDDPAANLELGAAYLSGLLREFGDARLAAAAYNAGPMRVREWWGARRADDLEVWVEQIPFNETRAFVKRVMLSWDEYHRLYGATMTPEPATLQDEIGLP
jgi:soluble lytic murein transglycosylase